MKAEVLRDEGERMKGEEGYGWSIDSRFILHPSAFILNK